VAGINYSGRATEVLVAGPGGRTLWYIDLHIVLCVARPASCFTRRSAATCDTSPIYDPLHQHTAISTRSTSRTVKLYRYFSSDTFIILCCTTLFNYLRQESYVFVRFFPCVSLSVCKIPEKSYEWILTEFCGRWSVAQEGINYILLSIPIFSWIMIIFTARCT